MGRGQGEKEAVPLLSTQEEERGNVPAPSLGPAGEPGGKSSQCGEGGWLTASKAREASFGKETVEISVKSLVPRLRELRLSCINKHGLGPKPSTRGPESSSELFRF